MNQETLYVCYSANNQYCMQLGVSLISLLENNKDIKNIKVFVLSNDMSEANRDTIYSITEKYGRNVEFVSTKNELLCLQGTALDRQSTDGGSVYSKTLGLEAYARFFIASVLPDTIERVLYLDCDTLVIGSLAPLLSQRFEGYLAAVVDSWPQKYNLVIGKNINDKYYNAGVQLIDLTKWREDNILEQYMDHIHLMNKPYRLFDQDIMNVVLGENISSLDLRYNMMYIARKFSSEEIMKIAGKNEDTFYQIAEIEAAKKYPVIIHYAGDPLGKPWRCYKVDTYTKLWKSYFDKSPWQKIGLKKSQGIHGLIGILKWVKITLERIKHACISDTFLARRIEMYMNTEVAREER